MHGIIHLKFTSNNTLVTLTGLDGKVIISYSGGNSGFKGSKKSTKYAKESIIEQIGLEATSRGYFRISLHFHGGKMRIRKCVRMLKKLGIKTLMINNLRKIAHNGCRPSKVRRI